MGYFCRFHIECDQNGNGVQSTNQFTLTELKAGVDRLLYGVNSRHPFQALQLSGTITLY